MKAAALLIMASALALSGCETVQGIFEGGGSSRGADTAGREGEAVATQTVNDMSEARKSAQRGLGGDAENRAHTIGIPPQ
jgi:hypothetical protein